MDLYEAMQESKAKRPRNSSTQQIQREMIRQFKEQKNPPNEQNTLVKKNTARKSLKTARKSIPSSGLKKALNSEVDKLAANSHSLPLSETQSGPEFQNESKAPASQDADKTLGENVTSKIPQLGPNQKNTARKSFMSTKIMEQDVSPQNQNVPKASPENKLVEDGEVKEKTQQEQADSKENKQDEDELDEESNILGNKTLKPADLETVQDSKISSSECVPQNETHLDIVEIDDGDVDNFREILKTFIEGHEKIRCWDEAYPDEPKEEFDKVKEDNETHWDEVKSFCRRYFGSATKPKETKEENPKMEMIDIIKELVDSAEDQFDWVEFDSPVKESHLKFLLSAKIITRNAENKSLVKVILFD